MIRTKVTLVYFVIVLLLGGLTVGLIHLDMGETTRENVRTSLRRSANVAEQSIRLDEASLLAKAEFIGGSETLHNAMVGGENEEEGEPPELSFVERRHLVAREKLDAQRYRLDDIAKAVAGRRNLELAPLERRPNDFDLFVTLDVKGQGVAALGKDLYSWFGEDVSKIHPGVREVAKSGVPRIEYWMWSFSPTQEKRPYRVAIAPIRTSQTGSTAGVVVLGTMLNDGIAATKQKLVVGLSEDSDDAAELGRAPQIVMYRGKNVIGSTFDSAEQKAVSVELDRVGGFTADSSAILDVTVSNTPYFAMVRPILGEGDAAIGIAVLADTDLALAPLQQLTTSLVLVFLLFGVLGGGLLFILILRWVQPVEQIENGIQEVLAGNRDFVWTPLPNHAIQTSLAQSLNLMSAFLQGKASPDDEDQGSWGLEMNDMSEVHQGPTKIQGVALPMMQAAPPKKDE
jgi:hypothetical protein